MSKLSISDLHHANDLAFVESIKLRDGDVLKAAAERAIAARIAGGKGAGKVTVDDGCGVTLCDPLIAGGLQPVKPLIAGGRPADPYLA
jgi:hypothetical protein